jgi:3'-5' exoribonuclease
MIAELLPGQAMNQIVLVNSFERRQKKNGEEYLKLIVKDISGLMDVMVWDRSEKEINDLETNLCTNKFVYIEGNVEKFKTNDNKESTNVKAKVIYTVDKPEDISLFEKTSKIPHAKLAEMLDSAILNINNQYLRSLCNVLIGPNGTYREKYLIWPAAKSFHHAYRGGLAEHSLEVHRFITADYDGVTGFLNDEVDVDWDLLHTAALLHDIAKIAEYDYQDGACSFTTTGELIGHLCLGAIWVSSALNKVPDFPKDLAIHLIHIILSHHERLDWGAAVVPKTKEAILFHMADNRSAKMHQTR